MKRLRLCPHCGKTCKQYRTGQAKTCGSRECISKSHRTDGPGLRQLYASAKEGECPLCGDPVKEGKNWKTCGDEICLSAYHRYYGRDRRRLARTTETK